MPTPSSVRAREAHCRTSQELTRPLSAPLASRTVIAMIRSGAPYGSWRSSSDSTTLKMAVLRPTPSANVRTAAAVAFGDRRMARKEKRRSYRIMPSERIGSIIIEHAPVSAFVNTELAGARLRDAIDETPSEANSDVRFPRQPQRADASEPRPPDFDTDVGQRNADRWVSDAKENHDGQAEASRIDRHVDAPVVVDGADLGRLPMKGDAAMGRDVIRVRLRKPSPAADCRQDQRNQAEEPDSGQRQQRPEPGWKRIVHFDHILDQCAAVRRRRQA